MPRTKKRPAPSQAGRPHRSRNTREKASPQPTDWEDDDALEDDTFSALDGGSDGDSMTADPDEGSRFARQMNARRQLERLREARELERQCNDDWALTG